MIGRILAVFTCGAALWAQLPAPQAPLPRTAESNEKKNGPDRDETARLDAVVYDGQGNAVAGLKESDFALTADGKQQKIDRVEYRTAQPLRLAVVLDDLALSADHNNAARRALREFVEKLPAGAEMAVLRTSVGAGAQDRFTGDAKQLQDAISRADYNPEAQTATADTLGGALRGPVRGALAGMGQMPGRKAVLFISERLRENARAAQALKVPLAPAANLGAASLYVVDMSEGGGNGPQLDLGLPGAARDTAGLYFESEKIAEALAQIAKDESAYYILTFRPDGAGYDLLTGAPRLQRVQLAAPGRAATVRARNGMFGAADDALGYSEDERDPARLLGEELAETGVRAAVTAIARMERTWQVNAIVHVDARDLTFTRGLDGAYRTTIETAAGLAPDNGAGPEERISRAFDLTMGDTGLENARKYGVDYTLTLAVTRPGQYQLRIVARDAASGRTGTAREAVAVTWGPNELSMSSLVIHGAAVKNAAGQESLERPEESSVSRIFQAGRRVTYGYELVNVGSDAEKRSKIEVQSRIWRDGALVVEGERIPVQFEPSPDPARREASGTLLLREQTRPGAYTLGVTVTDKITGRSATRFADFEVRP